MTLMTNDLNDHHEDYTDRAIYRPGQKVHVTAISYIARAAEEGTNWM